MTQLDVHAVLATLFDDLVALPSSCGRGLGIVAPPGLVSYWGDDADRAELQVAPDGPVDGDLLGWTSGTAIEEMGDAVLDMMWGAVVLRALDGNFSMLRFILPACCSGGITTAIPI